MVCRARTWSVFALNLFSLPPYHFDVQSIREDVWGLNGDFAFRAAEQDVDRTAAKIIRKVRMVWVLQAKFLLHNYFIATVLCKSVRLNSNLLYKIPCERKF